MDTLNLRNLAVAFGLFLAHTYVHAAFIETSAGCGTLGGSPTCDETVDDDYGYVFRIADNIAEANTVIGSESSRTHTGHSSDSNYYHATLTNTALSLSDALIDSLFFNMNATLGTDFTIENVDPNWTFSAASGGIQFDYVGERDSPFDRISAQDSLIFDFVFDPVFLAGIVDPFLLWTGTDPSLGTGAGGGEDEGQVAVSFQSLGPGGEGSDLLASNWEQIPAPGVLVLFGTGLLAMRVLTGRSRI